MPISQANIKALEVINEELNSLRHIEAVKAVIDSFDQMRNENLNSVNEQQLAEYLHQSVRTPLYNWYLRPKKAQYEDLLQTKLVLFILASYWPLSDNCCISNNPISDPKVNRVVFLSGHVADRNTLLRYWAHTDNNPHPVNNNSYSTIYADPVFPDINLVSPLRFQMNEQKEVKSAFSHSTSRALFIPLTFLALGAISSVFGITAILLAPYLLLTYAILAAATVGVTVLGALSLAIHLAIEGRSEEMVKTINKLIVNINEEIAIDSRKADVKRYKSEIKFIRNTFKLLDNERRQAAHEEYRNSFELILNEEVSIMPKKIKRISSEPSLLVNGKLNRSTLYSPGLADSEKLGQHLTASQNTFKSPSNYG